MRIIDIGTLHTSGRVTVTLTLPAGLTPTSASGSTWTCRTHGRVVTCTRTRVLPVHTVSTIHVTVHVTAAAGRRLTATATVAPSDATPGDNRATDSVRIS